MEPEEWRRRVAHTRMGLYFIHPKGTRGRRVWMGKSDAQIAAEKELDKERREMDKEKDEEVKGARKKQVEKLEKEVQEKKTLS